MKNSILLFAFTLLSGCATMVNGPTQMIGFSSNVDEATVTVVDKHSEEQKCKTPCFLTLKRDSPYLVYFDKSGYEEQAAVIVRDYSKWMVGNFAMLGPIGIVIDIGSGSGYELRPQLLKAELQKK